MARAKTDPWFADRTEIEAMWPGTAVGPDEHIHADACGGYYNHAHPDGQQKHSHDHKAAGCLRCRTGQTR